LFPVPVVSLLLFEEVLGFEQELQLSIWMSMMHTNPARALSNLNFPFMNASIIPNINDN